MRAGRIVVRRDDRHVVAASQLTAQGCRVDLGASAMAREEVVNRMEHAHRTHGPRGLYQQARADRIARDRAMSKPQAWPPEAAML